MRPWIKLRQILIYYPVKPASKMFFQKIKKLIIFQIIFSGVLMLTPFFAVAQVGDLTKDLDEPIVHCGTKASGTPCGVCDLFKLTKRLLDLAFFTLVPLIATLAIVYAGFLLLFSASPFGIGSVSEAQNIFKSVFVGLLTAYAAWLIVNTLVMFFAGDLNQSKEWYKFSCKVDNYGVINANGVLGGGAGNNSGDNGGQIGGGTSSCGNRPDWCCAVRSQVPKIECASDYTKDPNCILINNDNGVKSVISNFQCGSSGGKCYMHKDSVEGLISLATKIKDISGGKCFIKSVNGTIQGPSGPSKSNCHKNTGGQFFGQVYGYGTCADLSLNSQSGPDDDCIKAFKQAVAQSGGVSSYLIELDPPNNACSTPQSSGEHFHVHFKKP